MEMTRLHVYVFVFVYKAASGKDLHNQMYYS